MKQLSREASLEKLKQLSLDKLKKLTPTYFDARECDVEIEVEDARC